MFSLHVWFVYLVVWCSQRSDEGIWSFELGVTDICELPYGYWKLHLGPQEQQGFLTAEPSFSSPQMVFFCLLSSLSSVSLGWPVTHDVDPEVSFQAVGPLLLCLWWGRTSWWKHIAEVAAQAIGTGKLNIERRGRVPIVPYSSNASPLKVPTVPQWYHRMTALCFAYALFSGEREFIQTIAVFRE